MSRPTEGETHTVERTFTRDDVRQFSDLSRDTQPRHTDPDEDGRLLVHGLLTATLPTQIGGELEMLAHTMAFKFRKPVYTGETVTCRWTHDAVEECDDRYEMTVDVACTTEGETVLDGTVEGFVWKS